MGVLDRIHCCDYQRLLEIYASMTVTLTMLQMSLSTRDQCSGFLEEVIDTIAAQNVRHGIPVIWARK